MGSRFKVVSKERRTLDGVVFASMGEMQRYCELKNLLRAGKIFDLSLQPKFEFVVNGVRVGSYTADFRYLDETGNVIIEDRKSSGTRRERDYRIRKKLMLALYSIEVKETGI